MANSISILRHDISVIADKHPKSSWFVGWGVFAALSFIAGVAGEVYLGENADPYGVGMGVMLFFLISFSAPIVITHWAFSD